MLMLLLLPPIYLAAGLSAWYAYSTVQRKIVSDGNYATMRILSEIRTPDGDRSLLPTLTQALPSASSLDSSWVFLAGDKQVPKDVSIRKAKNNVACCFSEDFKYFALFGPEEPPNFSLVQLVFKCTIKPNIEENILARVNWDQKIADCIRASTFRPSNINGSYYAFCYRDYVNFEEFNGMMNKRWGMEKFWIRAARTGKLIVSPNKHVQLMDFFLLYGFWPIKVVWEGSLLGNNTIQWDTSRMEKGFKFFKKTIDRPPLSERLRASPWDIYLPEEEEQGRGDILIFHRRGAGKLVYAREECLSKIANGGSNSL